MVLNFIQLIPLLFVASSYIFFLQSNRTKEPLDLSGKGKNTAFSILISAVFLLPFQNLTLLNKIKDVGRDTERLQRSQKMDTEQLQEYKEQLQRHEKILESYQEKSVEQGLLSAQYSVNNIFSEKSKNTQILRSDLYFKHCEEGLGSIRVQIVEEGVRITKVKRKSFLWSMKLKNGDIIMQINDRPMRKTEDLLETLCIKKEVPLSREYAFTIQRRKRQKTILVRF